MMCELDPKDPEGTACLIMKWQSLIPMEHSETLRIQLKISMSTNIPNKI